MIHWTWLILAVFFGSFLGLVIGALCAASGRADLEHEIAWLKSKNTKEAK